MSDFGNRKSLETKIAKFEKNYNVLKIAIGLLLAGVVAIFWAGYYFNSALTELNDIRKIKGVYSDEISIHPHSAINIEKASELPIGEHRYCSISKFANSHPQGKCTCEVRRKERAWSIVLSEVNDARCDCFAACIK